MEKEGLHSHISAEEQRKIVYPFGYFLAQVAFALRWSEINNQKYFYTISDMTTIKNQLQSDDETWSDVLHEIRVLQDPWEISQSVYRGYIQLRRSIYHPIVPSPHNNSYFGPFTYNLEVSKLESGKRDKLRIHYVSMYRGQKSPLDSSTVTERQAAVKNMLSYIKETYVVDEVIGGSWLYNLPAYRDSFPSGFTRTLKRLVPHGFTHIPNSIAGMSFTDDSLWGQFVDRYGRDHQRNITQFLDSISASHTTEDLINAFPKYPLAARSAVSVFYNWMIG